MARRTRYVPWSSLSDELSVTNNLHSKPAKTPKTATKLKLTTPKAPAEDGGKKTPASKAKKASTKKGKAAANGDEDAGAEAKEPEKQVDPEQLKQKKEKEGMHSRFPNSIW